MTRFNLWHNVPIGKEQPDIVQAIISSPKGSKAKYVLDKETGLFRLDHVLPAMLKYPENYGFIPQTFGTDHDPLNILVLSEIEMQPFCIVDAKIIGVMRLIDSNEPDDKIIAVAKNDKSVSHINEVAELQTHYLLRLQTFFEEYKISKNIELTVEEFQNAEIAKQILTQAIYDYQKEFKK